VSMSKNAEVLTHLADVIDSSGLNYRSGISYALGVYYSIEFELLQDLGYGLSAVELATGNQSLVDLQNNTIGVGSASFTMSVWDIGNTPKIVGFISATSSSEADLQANTPCSPSGFYNLDPNSGNVACVGGNIKGTVVPMADFDRVNAVYYQVIEVSKANYNLVTYDLKTNSIVYNVACKICKSLKTLNFV